MSRRPAEALGVPTTYGDGVIAFVRRMLARRAVVVTVELVALAALLAALAWTLRDVWPDAAERLADADLVDLALASAVLAAYYLVFVLGWRRILRAYGFRVPYAVALRSEMLSMLAKYVPGGVWTPAARVVALRRYRAYDTPAVLASILLEAGLSAVAGVLVFVASLALVRAGSSVLVPLVAFALVVAVLVHPRPFGWLISRVLRPFGAADVPPLPGRTLGLVVAFYVLTWPLGGVALFFLIRSVGGDPGIETIPYLGGASAVGAIVAVLVVFAPSGLGVREASMYGLVLAVAPADVALGAIVLNRLAITVVEAALLAVGLTPLALRRVFAAGATAEESAAERDEAAGARSLAGEVEPGG